MATTKWLSASLMAVLVAGCASPTQKAEKKENLLLASGFVARPADTPQRQALLAKLPDRKLVRKVRNKKFIYLYADRETCNCLYIGDDKAIGQYQNNVYQRQVAKEDFAGNQELTNTQYNANLQQAALAEQDEEIDDWDWGLWGPGWWY